MRKYQGQIKDQDATKELVQRERQGTNTEVAVHKSSLGSKGSLVDQVAAGITVLGSLNTGNPSSLCVRVKPK